VPEGGEEEKEEVVVVMVILIVVVVVVVVVEVVKDVTDVVHGLNSSLPGCEAVSLYE